MQEVTNICFYSSPSCDGDLRRTCKSAPAVFLFFPVLRRGSSSNIKVGYLDSVSILPRLATGIEYEKVFGEVEEVSILPRLATGID